MNPVRLHAIATLIVQYSEFAEMQELVMQDANGASGNGSGGGGEKAGLVGLNSSLLFSFLTFFTPNSIDNNAKF